MENNLFLSLSKYTAKENNNPLENFVTESFAWLLNNNKDMLKTFFSSMLLKNYSFDHYELTTQYNLSGVYPDMIITVDGTTWIFEHKTFSKLHENQLQNYRDFGNEKFGSTKIVLITGTKFLHDQNPDYALTWEEVALFLQSYSEKSKQKVLFLDEFIELLNRKGLGIKPSLTYESIINYLPSKDFKKNLLEIFWVLYEQLKESSELTEFFSYYGESIDGNLVYLDDIKDSGGFVGIGLFKTWRPGISIGCLVDNKDHRASYSHPSIGIDFSLKFSFDQEDWYNDSKITRPKINYQIDEDYKNLMSELNLKITTIDGWEVYDHLGIEEDPNLWHPLYLRRSLAKVLEGTISRDEQVERLFNTTKELLGIVQDCESFKILRNKYQGTTISQ